MTTTDARTELYTRLSLALREVKYLPPHKQPRVGRAYDQGYWYAAGREDADGGPATTEPFGFAVTWTEMTLDYVTERRTSLPSLPDAYEIWRADQ